MHRDTIVKCVSCAFLLSTLGCGSNESRQYVGCWEDKDNRNSTLQLSENSRAEIRLFDLVNEADLREEEIAQFPTALCHVVQNPSPYVIADFVLDDNPAQLAKGCSSSFVVECAEALSDGRMRMWGRRSVDALWDTQVPGEARIYFTIQIGNEMKEHTIGRLRMSAAGTLTFSVEELGRMFFTRGGTYQRCSGTPK